jgi:hypothetical protein
MNKRIQFLGTAINWTHYRTARQSNAKAGDFEVVRCEGLARQVLGWLVQTCFLVGVVVFAGVVLALIHAKWAQGISP